MNKTFCIKKPRHLDYTEGTKCHTKLQGFHIQMVQHKMCTNLHSIHFELTCVHLLPMQSNIVQREDFFQGQHGRTPHAWHFA